MSAQTFDTHKIQGVRVTMSDGTVGTFYGPYQLKISVVADEKLTVDSVEILYPREGELDA